jgi:hypothetical protein
MTKDQVRSTEEALRLALEALEYEAQKGNDNAYQFEREAIKAALEAKDEPVAWMRTSGTGSPVVTEALLAEMPEMRWNFQQPLYTTPPQRQWVGLTDGEIEVIEALKAPPVHPDFIDCDDWMDFARAIETKLKEKNT